MGRSNSDFNFPSYRYIFWPRILGIVKSYCLFQCSQTHNGFFSKSVTFLNLKKSSFLIPHYSTWLSIRPAFTTAGSTMYLAKAFIAVLKTEDCMLSQSDQLFRFFLCNIWIIRIYLPFIRYLANIQLWL